MKKAYLGRTSGKGSIGSLKYRRRKRMKAENGEIRKTINDKRIRRTKINDVF